MEDKPTDIECAFLCSKMNQWENLRPHLGLTKPNETAIKKDNPGDYEQQKMAMLCLWKRRHGSKATRNALIAACISAGEIDLKDEIEAQMQQNPRGQQPVVQHNVPGPGQDPPGQDPPGQEPPGQDPPGQEPPGQDPPGQDPPGQDPPGQDPPGQDPPGQDPPGQDPPGQDPPGQDPPAPAAQPPPYEPLCNNEPPPPYDSESERPSYIS